MSRNTGNPGSVLVLALWTLFFLAALALAVGSHVAASLSLASGMKISTLSYNLARAGAAQAAMELTLNPTNWQGTADEDLYSDERLFRDNETLDGGTFSVQYAYVPTNSSVAVTNFGVVCEGRRLNLNRAKTQRRALLALMMEEGELDEESAQGVVYSVIDWVDANDDVTLTYGAETAYYEELNPSYPCANEALGSVEELLLVKGFEGRDGRELLRRIEPFVTVFGKDCFRGVATGRVDGSDTVGRIAFIYSKKAGRFVSWRE